MRHAFRIFLALSATLALAACSEADGTAEQGPGSPAAGGEGPGGKADDWGKDGRWAPGIPIGSFALRWNRTDSQLRIVDSATQRVVWETPAGADFVGAGVGAETVSSARGCFTFKDRTISSCGGATLDDVRAEGNGGAVARGTLKGCGRSYNLRFWEASSGQLAFQLDVSGDVNRVFLTHLSPPDEHLFGFGHQYSQLDMKGRRLPIWAGEQGIGRGAQPITWALNRVAPGCGGDWTTTYTAVPFYLSTHGRGFALDNTDYLVFDMTKNDRVTTEVWSNSVRGRIVAGGTPLDVLKNYTTWSGRMAPLPAWTQQGALLRTRGGSG
ncbi:MAG: hypothetical protein MUF54_15700, partial [Polyangiaceae bacterium]|nr:hypothetical protein [Polyangiaceae bacterium]